MQLHSHSPHSSASTAPSSVKDSGVVTGTGVFRCTQQNCENVFYCNLTAIDAPERVVVYSTKVCTMI